jgi:hypothetical protein
MYVGFSRDSRVCPRSYMIVLGNNVSVQVDVSMSYRYNWSRFVSWDLS